MRDAGDLREVKLYLGIRVFLLYAVLAWTLSAQNSLSYSSLWAILALNMASFSVTYFFSFWIDSLSKIHYFVVSQIAYDLLFCSALVFYSGGEESAFLIFYPVIVIYASLLMGRTGAVASSVGAFIAYLLMIVLVKEEYQGVFHMDNAFYSVGLVSIGILSASLMEEVRKNRSRLIESKKSLVTLNRFNHLVLENMSAGLILKEKWGKVRTLNHSVEQWVGLNSKEKTKEWLDEHWSSLNLENEMDSDKAVGVHSCQFPSGEKPIQAIKVSFKDSPGLELELFFLKDMSEFVKIQKESEINQRFASLGRMAANIAHEIRNPLAGISGAAEVLSKDMKHTDSETSKLFDIIVSESDRLNRLIFDFLNYSENSHEDLAPIPIHEILGELVDSVRARKDIPDEIKIILEGTEPTWIKGNSDQIKQIFLNLILNGIESIGPVSAEAEHFVKIKMCLKSRQCEIWIEDTGNGVLKDEREKIFEPFYTSKKTGTGLGLATTYRLVEAHSGRIRLMESEPGQGAVFKLQFPVVSEFTKEQEIA